MFELAQKRIARLAKWDNGFIKMLGMIEILMGVMLLVPSIMAVVDHEDPMIFFYLAPIFLILGLFQYFFFRSEGTLTATTGIVLITITWLMAFFVSAIPFWLYGFSFIDAVFEGVSGFTTTGATIVTDLESLPSSLLLWRSFIQWIGGIAVVMVFVFLLPMMGIGGRSFYNNEFSGSESDNFSMKMTNLAYSFIGVYCLFTIVEIILLLISGVNLFESACMTLSTISTGGMMVHGDSIASYSTAVQGIVLIFMFLGGTNFYLHFRAVYRHDPVAYAKNQEFIWTIAWFLMIIAVISAIILNQNTDLTMIDTNDTTQAIWEAAFTVVSIGTSTGFSITDYTLWPVAAVMLLWVVGMFGAMSGSTAGGIKIYRIQIIISYIKVGVGRFLHPNMVKDITMNKQPVSRDMVSSAIVVTMMFLITGLIMTFALLVLEPGLDLLSSFGLSIGTLGNIGIGFGDYGPLGSWAELTSASKLLLAFVMWVGRLEIILALIIFTKTFWRELIRNFNFHAPEHSEDTLLTKTLRYNRKK